MLPTKGVLSEKIQSLVNNNDKTDSAEAVKEFADGLAKLLIDTMKEADVVFQSGSINTVVTTTSGGGTGYNAQPSLGNLQ